MLRFAILIDGGFVKPKLGSYDSPISSNDVKALVDAISSHPSLRDYELYRAYFYDAPPFKKKVKKPLNGGRVAFDQDPIGRANDKLHGNLRNCEMIAVRMGKTVFRGWRLDQADLPMTEDSINITHEDLRPNIQQKAVDMRIGLDIAALTLKHQVDMIVLVAGDTDFVPAMKFARREGQLFGIAPLGHPILPELKEHADLLLNLDGHDIFKGQHQSIMHHRIKDKLNRVKNR